MFTVTTYKINKAAYFYFIFCQIVNASMGSIRVRNPAFKKKSKWKAGKYRKAQKYDREYERDLAIIVC